MSNLDINSNGIPDYREGWFWLAAGRLVSGTVKLLAPKHTIAYRTAIAFDEAVAKLKW